MSCILHCMVLTVRQKAWSRATIFLAGPSVSISTRMKRITWPTHLPDSCMRLDSIRCPFLRHSSCKRISALDNDDPVLIYAQYRIHNLITGGRAAFTCTADTITVSQNLIIDWPNGMPVKALVPRCPCTRRAVGSIQRSCRLPLLQLVSLINAVRKSALKPGT